MINSTSRFSSHRFLGEHQIRTNRRSFEGHYRSAPNEQQRVLILRVISDLAVALRLISLPLMILCCHVSSAQETSVTTGTSQPVHFERHVLSEQFYSEGADFGDIDGDGHNDIVSGPFWYAGPDFQSRHRYMSGSRVSIKAYSPHFFSFVHDFNNDRRPDILVIGMPGQPARWFQNPGIFTAATNDNLGDYSDNNAEEAVPNAAVQRLHWKSHLALNDVGNESPTLTDLTGDGRPELVCVHGGVFGFATPSWNKPAERWSFTPLNQKNGFGIFTHGLGVGDVDGDGKNDVLETNGWHQQFATTDNQFKEHAQRFAEAGGSQMFAYDFDGDGDNDVVAVQNAHAYGLTWFERRGQGDDMLWVPHPILTDQPNSQDQLPAISQMHGLALADMDGDGVKDLITGKRFYAHGGGDPGAFQLPVLYWFRTVRSPSGVQFEAHLIDSRIGVGTQLTVGDVDGNGRPDIVVGNKLGTHVLLNRQKAPKNSAVPNSARPNSKLPLAADAPGTEDFARGVRETGALTPAEEQATFVLPPGFKVRLVAAEPQINKPMNLAFDAKGKLWVTSTVEYPYPVEVGTAGRDSVKCLEDTNGDGNFDKVTTFADGLNIPIGLYPYKDGVICYSIPFIWHLRDTDGDGRCDTREKLYGPFDHTRDTHGMCNNFLRGHDGWLYSCHGFNNQSSVAGRDGNRVEMQSGNTFRVKLDGSRIEHYTHGQVNPFGLAYDARGDLLSADCHTKPVTLLLRGGFYDSFGKPHDGLGYVPDVMSHLHGSTAIAGIAIATAGTNFPRAYLNNSFGGNVMTSRINRNSLLYEGSSIQAQEEPDLLIAGDSWFRPVDLKFGPDGALYVADFYNRIIGHYEVPLTHPGRDRTRGRIWRITYEETGKPTDKFNAVANLSVKELITELASNLSTRRMQAADRLVDELGHTAIEPLKLAFATPKNAHQRVHAMWCLHRHREFTDELIDTAIADSSPLVRTHLFRVLGEQAVASQQTAMWLKLGFEDDDPAVRRAAAMASSHCVHPDSITGLMSMIQSAPATDPHLQHAARMALRDHLANDANFALAAANADDERIALIADICLSLRHAAGNAFLAKNIDKLSTSNKDKAGRYIQQAMQGVTEDTANTVVSVARHAFADDRDFQLSLLQDLQGSLQAQPKIPMAVRNWATQLATELLDVENASRQVTWESQPHPKTNDSQDAWTVSNRRTSTDSNGDTVTLWSSFPNGEQRTGVFRSEVFELPKEFTFYLAGHDGYPEQELQNRNRVLVRDADSNEILQSWSPPRNDTAFKQTWSSGADAGCPVVVELIDGDTAAAFAWLAAGQFSVAGLNPNSLIQNRLTAAKLMGEFRIAALVTPCATLMSRHETSKQTRAAMGQALAKTMGRPGQTALAAAMTVRSLTDEQQLQLADAILQDAPKTEQIENSLAQALSSATGPEQSAIATALSEKASEVGTLLSLAQSGKINTQVLNDPAIQSKITAVANAAQKVHLQELLDSLPAESETLAKLIETRKADYSTQAGDLLAGRKLFESKCNVCHQLGGRGKQVGPNLDGIGNRGLDRLCEDILAPHRNVDVAFRATTIVTDDGKAWTGLVKSETDTVLTLIDNTGTAQTLAKETIEVRAQSKISAMPANFGEVISPAEFRDLLSFLMSLRQ